MGFGITSVIAAFNRRYFISAGLRPTTVDIDGVTTLRCWVPESLLARPTTVDSMKPPLLLIHGFGPEATWQWQFQVRPLARHFDLIVPDLVFFGGSTTRSADRSEAFQAACVARLLDALGVRGTVSVVGTSYGGFVAYHLARALGEGRVGRVVIASSDLLKGGDDDVALLERAGVENVAHLILPRTADHLRILLRLALHRPPRFLPGFLLHDIIRNLYMANIDEKLELIKGVTLGNKEQFWLNPLPQEVLIVWGEHDNIFPLEKAHQIKKKLGEKARVEVLKNTGHVPQAEDPHRFNQVVLDFLLGCPRSSM